MRSSISEITTVGASFQEDVAAYAAAGLDAIGIWEMKLGAPGAGPDADSSARDLLARHGLGVACCIPLVPSILPLTVPPFDAPVSPAARVEGLCASIRRLAPFRPEAILCLAGPLAGRSRDEGLALVRDGLRVAARVAAGCGVRIAFEPVHPTQHDGTGFLHTLAEVDELLAAPGLEDVGVLLDAYHFAHDPSAPAWARANAARVAAFHCSDWPAEADAAARAAGSRVLPNPATSPAVPLLRALRAGGWDGSVDVELFSTPDAFWGLPLDEAAALAGAAARGLIAAAQA